MPNTLLVADDSVVIQKLVGLSFANEEIQLITTDNGDDAIAMVREHKPQLVLADVVMPGKSGYEVCQAIKQDPELGHIPVLLLTGTFEAFDEAKAAEVSADGHITKPFEAQVLVERVNELLARAAAAAPSHTQTPQSPPPASEGDYDFFEENTGNLAGDDIAPASFDDELLGDPLAGVGPGSDTAAGFAGDRTVAVMPEDPSPAPVAAPPAMDPMTPASPTSDTAAQAANPGTTALADFDFDATAPPGPTILADDFSFETTAGSGPTPPILADELFGDVAAPTAGETPPNSFDFGTSESLEAPAAASTGNAATADRELATPIPPLQPVAVAAPAFSSEPPDLDPAPAELLDLDPQGETAQELRVDLEPDASFSAIRETPAQPDPPGQPGQPAQPALSAPALATPTTTGAQPDLAPMIQERLHETLEKVAWEAFADISDTIVRQVIERVESIAWEVIPQMTETLVREEIRRMKGDSESD